MLGRRGGRQARRILAPEGFGNRQFRLGHIALKFGDPGQDFPPRGVSSTAGFSFIVSRVNHRRTIRFTKLTATPVGYGNVFWARTVLCAAAGGMLHA
jgi:hypothetical protein